ncbi:MAG: hypothetical protein RR337_08615, partial [Clostridia bacterium]
MLRNDYRRALIVLRPLTKGMSGHVRLERRTLVGSMRFTVQGAGSGMLHALLMADTKNGWVIYPLGTLSADARGQSGMIASFDPRALSGLDLNDYTLLALVKTGAGRPELVMTGMVNGSKEVNWVDVTDAATTPYQKSPTISAQPAQPAPVECCCEEAVEEEPVVDAPPDEDRPPYVDELPYGDEPYEDAPPPYEDRPPYVEPLPYGDEPHEDAPPPSEDRPRYVDA